MGYVIYLSELGYYTGKTYIHQGEVFPITDNKVEDRTKKYTSKIRAEKAAERISTKCDYVCSYEVKEI